MNILVAYASGHGSTYSIAVAIADELKACGLQSTCVDAAHVHRLEPYDAVILGSAVSFRRWRPEARRFLRRHAHGLAARPFWVFSSGPVGSPADDSPAGNEPPRTVARTVDLGARDHKSFGGVDHAPTPLELRERRDWHEIRAWAENIAADLRVPV